MINLPKYFTKNGWNLVAETGGGMCYLHHVTEHGGPTRGYAFVARFKYGSPVPSARHFAKFLTSNFTPAEYFAAMDSGNSPLPILESKGYVSYNMERAKKRDWTNGGYTVLK